jgi:ubiquinone/menaquinone biosynthesis C-methylase UbiE
MSDKDIEKSRYNEKAQSALDAGDLTSVNALTLPLKAPYDFYKLMIVEHLGAESCILEIGAGMGENTGFLLETGARVCSSDISVESLSVLSKRFEGNAQLTTKVADIEKLPFEDGVFDMVVNAGSLSYGDHNAVLNEIYRVLKPAGAFIAIDSLNNNPIYRFNRYVHYLRGSRSLSVIKRAPDLRLLRKYEQKFGKVEHQFFGSISYLAPLLNAVFGEKMATKISDRIDGLVGVKRSAFKFVMVAEKKL